MLLISGRTNFRGENELEKATQDIQRIAQTGFEQLAWCSDHFWEHYEYTGDEQFLREKAYPGKEFTDPDEPKWMENLKLKCTGNLLMLQNWFNAPSRQTLPTIHETG